MPYTSNPHIPEVRRQAVMHVRSGWSMRMTARHFGVQPSTISRWVKRMPSHGRSVIQTLSSRPLGHPRALPPDVVRAIISYRERYHRCADVIHWHLKNDGYHLSLSSVKRTLRRNHLTYPSLWKKWYHSTPRPVPQSPGKLIEIDTIMDGPVHGRIYIYTLLDVCSRWAYAAPSLHARAGISVQMLRSAQTASPFRFETIQSDHGSEFSRYFTKGCDTLHMIHRHSRVRTPTDNAHLERFNRTIQHECLSHVPRRLSIYTKEIYDYIHYYNYERPHMSLGMKTPMEVLRSY